MNSTHTLPADLPEHLDERASGLALVPSLLTLPAGYLYACFLLVRATRGLQSELKAMRGMLRDGNSSLLLERRSYWSNRLVDGLASYRQSMATLESLIQKRLVFRLLLTQLNKALDEASDVAETFALGADAEIDRLAKELSNVL